MEVNNKNCIKKQVKKEAIITLILYFIYFLWWYYFAYVAFEGKEQEYILGLPEWFFYSCILGLIFINILVYVCIKLFFKDIPFEINEDNINFKVDKENE